MHEQYSIPSRTATTETMRRAQEAKTTRRPRFPQPQATYKLSSAGNIPTRNVLVKRQFPKHATLWKQEEWCNIVVDDRSSSDDIGQRQEWCETTFSLMLTMSIIIIQNAWTIQQPFKKSDDSHNAPPTSRGTLSLSLLLNRDNEPSSRGENNEKIKISTPQCHLQNWFLC